MNTMKFGIITLIVFFSFNVYSQKPDDLIGIWLSEESDGQIQVYKKSDNKYYGKLIWMDVPNNPDGTLKLDTENPDEKLKSRKLLGLEILINFTFDAEDKKWEGGTIYDPQSGSTYKAYMWFEDGNLSKLYLRGYIGFSLIGKTSEWTREKEKRDN